MNIVIGRRGVLGSLLGLFTAGRLPSAPPERTRPRPDELRLVEQITLRCGSGDCLVLPARWEVRMVPDDDGVYRGQTMIQFQAQ
jgi:hypothetical protein